MLARYAYMYSGLLVQMAVVLGVCLASWWAPTVGNPWFQMVEAFGSRIASRKQLAIALLFFATVGVRLSLLPLLGVPLPSGHDDNSYLLMGDTFAHGRLANPMHPEWPSFETFHVLFQPTYSSIFPPAQGLALAIGEVLGSPWIGVLLSVSAMCSAIVWMLQGWMPARWALLGGVLAMLNLGIVSYWMNSYWGGAMAAIGGALVLGALPRMKRLQNVSSNLVMSRLTMVSLIMGVAIAILANSRPLEGFIFCLPVAGALLIWLGGKQRATLARERASRAGATRGRDVYNDSVYGLLQLARDGPSVAYATLPLFAYTLQPDFSMGAAENTRPLRQPAIRRFL